jgi:hypothetical protein
VPAADSARIVKEDRHKNIFRRRSNEGAAQVRISMNLPRRFRHFPSAVTGKTGLMLQQSKPVAIPGTAAVFF